MMHSLSSLSVRCRTYEFGQRRIGDEKNKAIHETTFARERIKSVSMKRQMKNSTQEGTLDLLLSRSKQQQQDQAMLQS